MCDIYFFNVGVNSKSASRGLISPIIPDANRFELVPIPEEEENPKIKEALKKKGFDVGNYTGDLYTYKNIFNKNDYPEEIGNVLEKITSKYGDIPVHFDPDFTNFTFGGVADNKEKSEIDNSISCIQPGDYLFFWAGLTPCSSERHSPNYRQADFYFVGYFVIEKRVKLSEFKQDARLKGNAHVRLYKVLCKYFDSKLPDIENLENYLSLDILIGDKQKSKKFNKAIPFDPFGEKELGDILKDANGNLIRDKLGISNRKKSIIGSNFRCNRRVFQGNEAADFLKYICKWLDK